jgi:hypothetical protein
LNVDDADFYGRRRGERSLLVVATGQSNGR